jgi:hypothetical protein
MVVAADQIGSRAACAIMLPFHMNEGSTELLNPSWQEQEAVNVPDSFDWLPERKKSVSVVPIGLSAIANAPITTVDNAREDFFIVALQECCGNLEA